MNDEFLPADNTDNDLDNDLDNAREIDPVEEQDAPIRRPRVYPEVAKERLIEATIEMLREQPFESLTVRSIAARADLNKATIISYFGSIGRLFMAASNRLTIRSFETFASSDETMPFQAPDLVLSIRFRAWLLTSGVDPDELRFEPGNEIGAILDKRQQERFGVSPVTAAVFTHLLTFLVEGYHVFMESHSINDDTAAKLVQLVAQINKDLPRTEEALGWNAPDQTDGQVEDQTEGRAS